MTIQIKKDGSMIIDLGAIVAQTIQTCAEIAKNNGGRIVKIDYPKQIEQLEETLTLAEHRDN